MSGEAYEMPDGLLTMDAADAADAWYREASALRSRVEALEGENERLREEVRRRLPQPTLEAASAAATLAQVIAALARLTDEKALARAGMEALNDLKLHGSKARADEIKRARAALQPDKGERCVGTGWLDPRAEHAPCPGCKEDVR